MVLTAAETVSVVELGAVAVAGMVAVSESVVVMAVKKIETGSSQGHKWHFCTCGGRQNNQHPSLL